MASPIAFFLTRAQCELLPRFAQSGVLVIHTRAEHPQAYALVRKGLASLDPADSSLYRITDAGLLAAKLARSLGLSGS